MTQKGAKLLLAGTRAVLGGSLMLRHDYIKRFIERMAAFLAKLGGLAEAGRLIEASGELEELERELGLPRGYDALDVRSLVLLLGQGDKAALASILVWHRAEIAAERGNVVAAAGLQARARELHGMVSRNELSRQVLELLVGHPLRADAT